MNKILTKIWVSAATVLIMLATASLLLTLYVFIFFRKIFYKDFVPNAHKQAPEGQEDLIGSAQGQMNAIQASLEKPDMFKPKASYS